MLNQATLRYYHSLVGDAPWTRKKDSGPSQKAIKSRGGSTSTLSRLAYVHSSPSAPSSVILRQIVQVMLLQASVGANEHSRLHSLVYELLVHAGIAQHELRTPGSENVQRVQEQAELQAKLLAEPGYTVLHK